MLRRQRSVYCIALVAVAIGSLWPAPRPTMAQGLRFALYLPWVASDSSAPPIPSPSPRPSPTPPHPSAVRISEVAPSGTRLSDEDGEFPDWLELHNAGSQTADLGHFALSDDPARRDRWRLPAVTLAPGERLVVLASGKDRPSDPSAGEEPRAVHHWETAVQDGSTWHHVLGAQVISSGWIQPAFAADGWLEAPGGIGYGDGDDATLVPPGTLSVYARTQFTVTDRAQIVALLLNMDFDDGFVAYLNAVEVARSNLAGTPPSWDELAEEHEATLYQGAAPRAFPVDPAVTRDVVVVGTNVLAVQVHNNSPESSDLTLRPFLHVGLADAARQFADNPPWFVPPTGGGPGALHTNFKLKAGETLSLSNPDGTVADSVVIRADLHRGHVMTRQDDAWCVSDTETPALPYDGPCYGGYAEAPAFSPPSGFYPGPLRVSIRGSNLRVASGGELPGEVGVTYTGPIDLDGNAVLRAVASAPDRLPSAVVSASYFLGEASSLPVVSLVARPADLFEGTGADGPAIYDNYASDVKVPGHVSYFDAGKTLRFGDHAAVRIVGNFSKAFAQKSMQFTFEGDYGARGDVPNALFATDKPALGKLRGFRIRNMDDDASSARMRDVIANRLALGTAAAATASQNVAVYINGEYWGHYVARELLNEYFVRDNYGADPEAVDIVKTHVGETFADAGTMRDFDALRGYLATADLASDVALAGARERADLANWADYWATQIFIANGDWYSSEWLNNTQAFRGYSPHDTKWQFVLWDCAYSQDLGGGTTAAEFDSLHYALAAPGKPNIYTTMMNGLLRNEGYRRYFINRFADLLNDTWTAPKIAAMIDANARGMASEIAPNHARWIVACGDNFCPPDLSRWEWEVARLKHFYAKRPAHQREQLIAHFGLRKAVDVTLRVQPAGAGRIRISTLTPSTYPWLGTYFDGNPVTVTALPAAGFVFKSWSPNAFIGDVSRPEFTTNVSAASTTWTASFECAVHVGAQPQPRFLDADGFGD